MTAAVATFIDFLVMLFLVELLGFFYVIGVFLGAVFGGITNFYLNRNWAFNTEGKTSAKSEAARYFFVSAGSMLWNTFLVWLLTENLFSSYLLSKAVVVLIVALLWNYPLQRFWVFKDHEYVQKTDHQIGN